MINAVYSQHKKVHLRCVQERVFGNNRRTLLCISATLLLGTLFFGFAQKFRLDRIILPNSRANVFAATTVALDAEHSEHTYGVVGILTTYHLRNTQLRSAQRLTTIKDSPADVKFYFLLDRRTPSLEIENASHGDIIYLESNYSGRAVRFGEKMDRWLHLAIDLHPEAAFIGKMDDDAYIPTHTWGYLKEVYSSTIYLGYVHALEKDIGIGLDRRVDEAFVIIGKETWGKLLKRRYCYEGPCNKQTDLFDTNYGGTSLGLWLSIYSDINLVPINGRAIFSERYDPTSLAVCEKLMVHPATSDGILTMHKTCCGLRCS